MQFELNTRVTDLGFHEDDGENALSASCMQRDGTAGEIAVGASDLRPCHAGFDDRGFQPRLHGLGARAARVRADGGAWALWEKIAAGRPEFGRPSVFADHVDQSKWVSFTTTLHDPPFFRIVRELTGNVPGEGGLITFPDSDWLASIVYPAPAAFHRTTQDVDVFWGYGLLVDQPGNFVKKPMSACTGREIMTEMLGHLRIEAEAATDPLRSTSAFLA